MRLIIGGYAQGKTKYARELFPQAKLVHIRSLDGEKASGDAIIISGLNEWVKECMKSGKMEEELQAFVDSLVESFPEAVFITDENGNGVVPIKKAERDYRDVIGHIQISLAGKAERVERVVCGIPVIIK